MNELYECTSCGALVSASTTHRFCSGLYPRSDLDLDLLGKRRRRRIAAHSRLDEEANRGVTLPKGRVAVPKRRRNQLMKRGACENCGSSADLTIDHKMPVSRGGTNDPDNLQVLCRSCNEDKGDRTMTEWRGKA